MVMSKFQVHYQKDTELFREPNEVSQGVRSIEQFDGTLFIIQLQVLIGRNWQELGLEPFIFFTVTIYI